MEKCTRLLRLAVLCAVVYAPASSNAQAPNRSIVESLDPNNSALIVGVSHGLSGIDIDVDNLEAMAAYPKYAMRTTVLEEEMGTSDNILAALTETSRASGANGTMLYYFSGHGGVGTLLAQNGTFKIEAMRASIEAGRVGQGPLARLIMIFDSCFAGSLLDPLRRFIDLRLMDDSYRSRAMAEDITAKMMNGKRESAYWKKLLVIASSTANESSLAGVTGSVFTNAMVKAFKEGIANQHNIGQFIAKSQEYTVGHHPVARLVPESLATEKLE